MHLLKNIACTAHRSRTFSRSIAAPTPPLRQVARISRSTVVALSLSAAALSGCGSGQSAAPAELSLGQIAGVLHGGANPISGATVTLYETQTGLTANGGNPSGYGTRGLALATGTTNASGFFSFDNAGHPYTCTSTEFAYIAAVGGNTGGGATNNQSVLMAPLGSCTNLSSQFAQSATSVVINEASSVASAYALGNFMTVSGAAGAQTVNIGAPVTNATATGSCTVNVSNVTTACTAAGLAHAFANAYNLVDAVGYNGAVPSGNIRSALPNNTASVVPRALLNSLANSVQACVNSGGGAAIDTSTLCGQLFSYTAVGSSVPTDTLTASIGIASHPDAERRQHLQSWRPYRFLSAVTGGVPY